MKKTPKAFLLLNVIEIIWIITTICCKKLTVNYLFGPSNTIWIGKEDESADRNCNINRKLEQFVPHALRHFERWGSAWVLSWNGMSNWKTGHWFHCCFIFWAVFHRCPDTANWHDWLQIVNYRNFVLAYTWICLVQKVHKLRTCIIALFCRPMLACIYRFTHIGKR